MAFDKIIWQDLPNETTPLNADNLNLLVQDMMVSDEYDPTSTYTVGSYCIYQNTLYKCTTEIATAEEFNAGHWTETTISNEITAMQSDVTNIESDVANLENKTQLATTITAGLMSATDKAKLDNVQSTYFSWTPTYAYTTGGGPTVANPSPYGRGIKIKANDTTSLVFVTFHLGGTITEVTSRTDAFAMIGGLPYSASTRSTCSFDDFYKGVADNHPIPTGLFGNGKSILLRNGTRGSSVERWVTGGVVEIYGSGYYITGE